MRSPLSVALALTALLHAGVDGQQARDNRSRTEAGSARITGIVVADDRESKPLRRARVSISSSELDLARSVVTADDGTFAFERLPPGRYSVSAAKDGFVSMSLGARRPGRTGPGLEVAAAESGTATIRLPRGAVITGTVLNPHGEPAAGMPVIALAQRYIPGAGERRLAAVAGSANATTDDRGVYRIFGLPAGTYVVGAVGRLGAALGPGEMQTLSDAEVRRALAEVREQSASPRPGMPAPLAPTTVPQERRRSVTYAPVYFPGTTTESRATPLTVSAGEVRTGVNFDLELVPLSTVEGSVNVPPGTRVVLMLGHADPASPNQATRMTAIAADDGRFVLRSVPPGHYTITARAVPNTARSTAVPNETSFFGTTGVIVTGDDISGIAIPLTPGLTISGRIAFDAADGAVPDLGRIRIPVPPAINSGGNVVTPPSVLVENGTFSMAGVQPGLYRFPTALRGVRAPLGRWWLKSLTIAGKEILDTELELRENVEDAVLTFADRAGELAGVARYKSGLPIREGFVVIFSADRRSWFQSSRRVAGVRPGPEGRYSVRNLPAGEYFVAITTELESNEWFDPVALESLAAEATRVELKDFEQKPLDLISRR